VTSPIAYARVISITVDALAQTIDLGIGIYASAVARNSDALPFDTFHAWPNYGAFLGHPIDVRAATYVYLKQLPQFTFSADV
jgi:hypothetical protein